MKNTLLFASLVLALQCVFAQRPARPNPFDSDAFRFVGNYSVPTNEQKRSVPTDAFMTQVANQAFTDGAGTVPCAINGASTTKAYMFDEDRKIWVELGKEWVAGYVYCPPM